MTAVKDCIKIDWVRDANLFTGLTLVSREPAGPVTAILEITNADGTSVSDDVVRNVHYAFWLAVDEAKLSGTKLPSIHTVHHDRKNISPRDQDIIEGQALAWCGIAEDDPAGSVSRDELLRYTRPEGVRVCIRFVRSEPGLPS